MNSTHGKIALLASLPMVLGGCHGVVWGNMAVLSVTVGLFFGTLSLGRRPANTNSAKSSATRTYDATDRQPAVRLK